MDIFEYLPQLIVAYDSNDKFANLIHVKKADVDKDYYCPCCGGTVKPRAINSTKEQSHYYHISGNCTKESQLHFFCKNWLFKSGSKFFIDGKLFEVKSIDIEKTWETKFGGYRPDITVYTKCGSIIYFEMFFTNRKTGDDYFCKWNDLGNDVVEVNIKEYIYKTEKTIIPSFSYLYHDGKCYSKAYFKRDLYANTIAKIKNELTRQKVLNYKARIEQLDWFWEKIRNNESAESILSSIKKMDYEDMLSCYTIIKRKQCVSYLKNDVVRIINDKVISNVRESIGLPRDDNVYFDLRHLHGRTYEAGIRLNITTKHIVYDGFYMHCYSGYSLNTWKGYPKVVFTKNIIAINELIVPESKLGELKEIFTKTVNYRDEILSYENDLSDFESAGYKVRVKNNLYTVLTKQNDNSFLPILKDFKLCEFDINALKNAIQLEVKKTKDKKFMDEYLNSESCRMQISELQNYNNCNCHVCIKYENKRYTPNVSGIYFRCYIDGNVVYEKLLYPTIENFLNNITLCKKSIDNYMEKYSFVFSLVQAINNCRNGLWSAEFKLNQNSLPEIIVDQKSIPASISHWTSEIVKLYDRHNNEKIRKSNVVRALMRGMRRVMCNMEKYGYRMLEVLSE